MRKIQDKLKMILILSVHSFRVSIMSPVEVGSSLLDVNELKSACVAVGTLLKMPFKKK